MISISCTTHSHLLLFCVTYFAMYYHFLLTANFVCKRDGYYRDTQDCNKFYRCAAKVKHFFSCPDGLVFDERTSSCDFPERVPECRHYDMNPSPGQLNNEINNGMMPEPNRKPRFRNPGRFEDKNRDMTLQQMGEALNEQYSEQMKEMEMEMDKMNMERDDDMMQTSDDSMRKRKRKPSSRDDQSSERSEANKERNQERNRMFDNNEIPDMEAAWFPYGKPTSDPSQSEKGRDPMNNRDREEDRMMEEDEDDMMYEEDNSIPEMEDTDRHMEETNMPMMNVPNNGIGDKHPGMAPYDSGK